MTARSQDANPLELRSAIAAWPPPTTRQSTPEYLALLAAEYRARRDEPGVVDNMAAERSIHRTTLWRQIQEATERGFLWKDREHARRPGLDLGAEPSPVRDT